MALAKAGMVGDINTGDISILDGGIDIDLFSGNKTNIGNSGVSSEDIAKLFAAQAQTESIQAAREREERRRRIQLITIITVVIAFIFLIILLLYFSNKNPK